MTVCRDIGLTVDHIASMILPKGIAYTKRWTRTYLLISVTYINIINPSEYFFFSSH